jgi:hypothetical protein
MTIEEMKINADMKRLDLEKSRLESEERQKKEEGQHQYNMMQMIFLAVSVAVEIGSKRLLAFSRSYCPA